VFIPKPSSDEADIFAIDVFWNRSTLVDGTLIVSPFDYAEAARICRRMGSDQITIMGYPVTTHVERLDYWHGEVPTDPTSDNNP
jgi:hypothetical protein